LNPTPHAKAAGNKVSPAVDATHYETITNANNDTNASTPLFANSLEELPMEVEDLKADETTHKRNLNVRVNKIPLLKTVSLQRIELSQISCMYVCVAHERHGTLNHKGPWFSVELLHNCRP
jgi:hypothetical protein